MNPRNVGTKELFALDIDWANIKPSSLPVAEHYPLRPCRERENTQQQQHRKGEEDPVDDDHLPVRGAKWRIAYRGGVVLFDRGTVVHAEKKQRG